MLFPKPQRITDYGARITILTAAIREPKARYVELSEGRLIVPPLLTYKHQEVLKRVFLRLHTFVEEHGLGTVQLGPLPVRLWPGKIREPDVFFLAKEHFDRLGSKVCGVPDLVVEVLSAGTRELDRRDKFFEYAHAGVTEYWLVDPEKKTIEVNVLRGRAYELVGKFGPGEQASSAYLAGFVLDVDAIFSGISGGSPLCPSSQADRGKEPSRGGYSAR